MGAARLRQRIRETVHENRHHRDLAVGRDEMPGHGEGVIDGELLRERQVKAVLDARAVDMGGKALMHGDLILRHGRLVVRPGGLLRHAHGEEGEIVEEKRVEMVVGENEDHIGLHLLDMAAQFAIEGVFHKGGVFRDGLGQIGRMGRTQARDDPCHSCFLVLDCRHISKGLRPRQALPAASPGAKLGHQAKGGKYEDP